nr:hypothetical protein [Tanacetum cinerariifolium]
LCSSSNNKELSPSWARSVTGLLHRHMQKQHHRVRFPAVSYRVCWVNYICSFVKRGHIFANKEDLIIRLHRLHVNRTVHPQLLEAADKSWEEAVIKM